MSEEKAQEAAKPASGGGQAPKPMLWIILSVFNMVVVAGLAVILWMHKKKVEEETTIKNVVEGEKEHLEEEAKKPSEFIGTLIPLETFLVNLSGNRGDKLAKINLELEVDKAETQEEIEKRKPQIRDIIIILLSSKSYTQLSAQQGKDFLRNEIKETVNSFLTTGEIKRVYFTEFIIN